MTDDPDESARRIAEAGRREVAARLRQALARQAEAAGVALMPDELDHHAAEALAGAGGALWRRALAGAAAAELGIPLGEAIIHPAVLRAHDLVEAPPFTLVFQTPPPAPSTSVQATASEVDAIRVAAVHLGGIEALRVGEQDIELRLSPAGLDVLRRSSGAPIGRLEWTEIENAEVPRARRGLRPGRRRCYELHVATGRGRASFELPGVTEEQLKDHLEPMLARARGRV